MNNTDDAFKKVLKKLESENENTLNELLNNLNIKLVDYYNTYDILKKIYNEVNEQMSNNKYEYIIVGDTEKYDGCLILICGTLFENADSCLNRMINNPTENDIALSKGHSNLRIKKILKKDCWWNYGCD